MENPRFVGVYSPNTNMFHLKITPKKGNPSELSFWGGPCSFSGEFFGKMWEFPLLRFYWDFSRSFFRRDFRAAVESVHGSQGNGSPP